MPCNQSMVHQLSKLGLDIHFALSALHYGHTVKVLCVGEECE